MRNKFPLKTPVFSHLTYLALPPPLGRLQLVSVALFFTTINSTPSFAAHHKGAPISSPRPEVALADAAQAPNAALCLSLLSLALASVIFWLIRRNNSDQKLFDRELIKLTASRDAEYEARIVTSNELSRIQKGVERGTKDFFEQGKRLSEARKELAEAKASIALLIEANPEAPANAKKLADARTKVEAERARVQAVQAQQRETLALGEKKISDLLAELKRG